MANTGDKLVATSGAFDSQVTTGTTASLTYTPTLTGGTACGVTFLAPPSGQVAVFWTCEGNNGANFALSGVEVRAGGTIGSGVVVGLTMLGTANDDKSLFHVGDVRGTVHHVVGGLTPGATYNARSLFRVNAGGPGNFGRKELTVLPMP